MLLAQLPEGSRVWQAYNADAAWTSDRALMAAMVNDLNWLVWSQTKDGQKGRNRPKSIGPGQRPKTKSIKGEAMSGDELMARLAAIHGEEADHG